MTAYVVIADSEIDPDSPITTGLMTKIRDNPIAITQGSAGAPNIQTAGLDQTGGTEAVSTATIRSSAVVQAKLSTLTASTAGTLFANTKVNFGLNAYAFFPMVHATESGVGENFMAPNTTDGASPDNPRFAIDRTSTGNESYDMDYRYLIA